MDLRKVLSSVARVIAEESEQNPEFRRRLLNTLGMQEEIRPSSREIMKDQTRRPKNRRRPSVLDPIDLAASGESALRSRLADLTTEQLQDIVSEFGMDPGRLVVKWKTPERIIDRIVELALARAQKGDAFRSGT